MALGSHSVYFNDEDAILMYAWGVEQAGNDRISFSTFMVNLLAAEYKRQTEGVPKTPSQGRVLARLDQVEQTLLAQLQNIKIVHHVQGTNSKEQATLVDAVATEVIDSSAMDDFMGEETW